jgi:hypothetical protein
MQEGGLNPELWTAKAYKPTPTSFPSPFNLGSCGYCHQAFLEDSDVLVPMCLLSHAMQQAPTIGQALGCKSCESGVSLQECSGLDGDDGEM